MTSDLRDKWFTVQEVAERFQVSQETVRRWIRAGEIPVLDLGGPKAGYRIRANDLDEFMGKKYGLVGKTAA